MRFHTTLFLGGKTATGMEVPEDVVLALGSGKRPAVRVTINDYTYRSTVAPMSGKYFLPVSAEVRAHAGVAAGDEFDVSVELDSEPREVTVPPDRFWIVIEPPALLLIEVVAGNVTGSVPPFIETSAPLRFVNWTLLTVSPAGATPVAAPIDRPVVPPVTITWSITSAPV